MTQRQRNWSDTLYPALNVPAGGSVISNLLSASGSAPSDTLTVVRVLIGIDLHVSDIKEDEYTQTVDMGIGVSSVEAFNLGVTALPDPNTVGDYPPRGWIWISRYMVQQSLPTGGTPTAMFRVNKRVEVDIHAMRKIDKGVLFLVVRNTQTGLVATGVLMTGRIRCLCLT